MFNLLKKKNDSQVHALAILVLAVALLMVSVTPDLYAAVPAQPNVELGDIVSKDDSVDERFVKIFSWILQGIGAILIIGVLVTFFVMLWTGLEKVRDDKKHKDFGLGELITHVMVGIVVLIFSIPIGITIYQYGTSISS